jgi:pimeloyl-ACP methyl ester carboxylesterase
MVERRREALIAEHQRGENMSIQHRTLEANGIRLHVVEQGQGPLVLFAHGAFESWYSYRHQLPALAAGGYHAVAVDMRGYGDSDRPGPIEQYGLLELVGDMVGLVDALGEPTAVLVGSDWGATVAWHSALRRPDRFRAVVGISVPYVAPGPERPTVSMPQTADALFYQLYFQSPGVAEADLERDVRQTLRRVLCSLSGDARLDDAGPAQDGMVPRQGGLISHLKEPVALPAWLSEADLDVYEAQFRRSGFAGGLNWYRNIDRNWELSAPFRAKTIDVPALFITGAHDLVRRLPGTDRAIAELPNRAPRLQNVLHLAGCGHWAQQEMDKEVSGALLAFIANL